MLYISKGQNIYVDEGQRKTRLLCVEVTVNKLRDPLETFTNR